MLETRLKIDKCLFSCLIVAVDADSSFNFIIMK